MTTPTPPPTLHQRLVEAVELSGLAVGVESMSIYPTSEDVRVHIYCDSPLSAAATMDRIHRYDPAIGQTSVPSCGVGRLYRLTKDQSACDLTFIVHWPDEIPADVQERLVATTRAAAEDVARAEAGS